MREKVNAKVLFDEETWQRFNTEVPKVRIQILCRSFDLNLNGVCLFACVLMS
jgi:hypothetical protein